MVVILTPIVFMVVGISGQCLYQNCSGDPPRSHGTLIGALRDGGLSRHADDCEMDISERDVELLQSVAMKADV